MLVGNKIDKVRQDPGSRQVDVSEGRALAQQYGFTFVETSAFADENVTTAFEQLLNGIVEHKVKAGDNLDESRSCLKLHDPELDKDEKAWCC